MGRTIRTGKAHALEVLKLAGFVVALAACSLKRADDLVGVNLVVVCLGLVTAGNRRKKLGMVSKVFEQPQRAHVCRELDGLCGL